MHLLRRYKIYLEAACVIILACLGFAALRHLMAEVHRKDISAALSNIGGFKIALSLILIGISYASLTFYDVLALQILKKPVSYLTAAIASLTSYTLSHNLGFALLTGGSARYKIYKAAGLGSVDVGRVIALTSAGFWSGVFLLCGISLVAHPVQIPVAALSMPAPLQRALGGFIISLVVAGFLLMPREGHSLRWRRWSIPAPTPLQALKQCIAAVIDLAAASAALLVLVPGASVHQFPLFFLGYALAIIAVLISHVPGGIGVFESVILLIVPDTDRAALVGALILYRLLYYVLPLLAAGLLYALYEHRRFRGTITSDISQLAIDRLAPTIFATLTFVGGLILLVSGSLPAEHSRMSALREILPLPFVEASHIAASLVGTGLILLAPGLYRRLDAAWFLTRTLLVAGAIFSLAKGIDYEEATVLLVLASLIQLAKPAFYRRTTISAAFTSRQSIISISICLILAIWIGLFAYRHVAYQDQLWWHFAWKGDASRFMRATFASAVMLTIYFAMGLFGYSKPSITIASQTLTRDDINLAKEQSTNAMLALTGDKILLRAPGNEAFLMYRVQGQSWIVMGDPVGPERFWPELMWELKEVADRSQGRLLLYQISIASVPIAIEMGMQLIKYGEEARVFLPDFSRLGPAKRNLRHAARRALAEGACFEIVPAGKVSSILAELKEVSDEWLHMKHNREKQFSVGHFNEQYLSLFDCATIRQHGKLVAFANIWATNDRSALSVDLMRHRLIMPYGAMDLLFLELMEWGKAQGYQWFDLGLAPLSGISKSRSAPVWAQISNMVYRHAGALYSFEGLRLYKAKFGPIWEPRYIASTAGPALARSLIDLQSLIRRAPGRE